MATFWAVTAAFLVFTGFSTRGEVLTRGWQRVLGDGGRRRRRIMVAVLVGGHVAVTVGASTPRKSVARARHRPRCSRSTAAVSASSATRRRWSFSSGVRGRLSP
jgi:hypothetical protein